MNKTPKMADVQNTFYWYEHTPVRTADHYTCDKGYKYRLEKEFPRIELKNNLSFGFCWLRNKQEVKEGFVKMSLRHHV